jgi:hypothetical protein
MQEQIRKIKDEYVIFRFDENEKDWRCNTHSEYWNWKEWKPWLKNAKKYRFEDSAINALIKIRINRRNGEWI